MRTAVNEIESLHNKDFTAVLGEPDIEENAGRYFKDPKVVIPLVDSPFDTGSRLVFDLPEGRDTQSQFVELLDVFGLTFENMETLEGEVVPVTFYGGNAVVDWQELDEEPPKGSEESHYSRPTDEEAEEAASDSTVNVEEETYSAGDSGDEENDD